MVPLKKESLESDPQAIFAPALINDAKIYHILFRLTRTFTRDVLNGFRMGKQDQVKSCFRGIQAFTQESSFYMLQNQQHGRQAAGQK
jgi:hypothetical protein